MASPVSSMFTDPTGSAQDMMTQMSKETEEQRRKRMEQQKMQQASGTSNAVSSLFSATGNQF